MAFIDDMRSRGHAVESTCRILREQGCRVAARTYRAWRQTNRPVAARTRHEQAHYAASKPRQQPQLTAAENP